MGSKRLSGKNNPLLPACFEWHNRTNQSVFTWQEPRWKGGTVSYEDQKSTWNTSMRKVIRRGSAREKVRTHWDRLTGAWKQISRQRRRVDESHDPSMVTALWHGTWMDEESFKKTCIKEKGKRGGTHQLFYGTWIVDFTILRQHAGRFMLGKYLIDKKNSWKRRRQSVGITVARSMPTSRFLTKLGKMQPGGC